jgi:hypothetical protein
MKGEKSKKKGRERRRREDPWMKFQEKGRPYGGEDRRLMMII